MREQLTDHSDPADHPDHWSAALVLPSVAHMRRQLDAREGSLLVDRATGYHPLKGLLKGDKGGGLVPLVGARCLIDLPR
jgi:hypothetical protein